MQRDEQDRLNAANAELETILTTFSAEKDDNETDLLPLFEPLYARYPKDNKELLTQDFKSLSDHLYSDAVNSTITNIQNETILAREYSDMLPHL